MGAKGFYDIRTFGRSVLYTNADYIDDSNITTELTKIMPTLNKNISEIKYLYEYYKGKQPIISRKKKIRPEICNKIVENRANEIVSFKTGYLVGEPIQYVSQKPENSEQIERLNSYLLLEKKATKDTKLCDWQNICGTAYRMILPDKNYDGDTSPFQLYTLDPRNAFVVYSSKIGNEPIFCGYTHTTNNILDTTYCIYTKDKYFEVNQGRVIKEEDYTLDVLPIIEYPANEARLGAFEIVTDLLNAINLFSSNRIDGVEQFIQSLMVLKNFELPEDLTANELRESGLIQLISQGQNEADIKILSEQLDQMQNQALKDDMVQTVLTIVGMPSQGNGTSDSSNNGAVILKNGWQSAEARAKKSEAMWRESETEAIRVMLRICRDLTDMTIYVPDISVKFTRRNYADISTKAQVLVSLLNNNKVAPIDAYTICGLFADPEEACNRGLKYYEEFGNKEEMKSNTNDTTIQSVDNGMDNATNFIE